MVRLGLVLVLPLIALSAVAQAPATAPPPACTAAEHRQFDFWLGEWTVAGGPKLDKNVGHSSITTVSDGCAILEHWVNAGGKDGRSLNGYDRIAKQWTQFWIGFDGTILRLHGGLVDGAMLMHGELPGPKGGIQKQRVRWTPNADGTVEQRWETSDDDGASWQVSFLGIYSRAGASVPAAEKDS